MDADTPQGALAVADLPRGGVTALPHRPGGVYLFLDGIQDPGNLGAIARAAEAAGAAGLACGPGTAHPNHPRALRASAGSLLRLPVAVDVAARELADYLAPLQARWAALVAHGGRDLYAEPLAGTVVLALGAEGPGLSAETERLADLHLRIPTAAAGRVAQRRHCRRRGAVRAAPPRDAVSLRGGPYAFASLTAAVSAGSTSCRSPTMP